MYRTIFDVPAKFQFDSNSGLYARDNCRPTCDSQIIEFYRDISVKIASMRYTEVGSASGGVDVSESVHGLNAYGVPSMLAYLTIPQLFAKLSANIPVDICMVYGLLSDTYKQDKNFTGNHAVLACSHDGVGEYIGVTLTIGTQKDRRIHFTERCMGAFLLCFR